MIFQRGRFRERFYFIYLRWMSMVVMGLLDGSCLTLVFAFHVCHRETQGRLDFVSAVVECHRCSCHSLTQHLLTMLSMAG